MRVIRLSRVWVLMLMLGVAVATTACQDSDSFQFKPRSCAGVDGSTGSANPKSQQAGQTTTDSRLNSSETCRDAGS
jgi:hypothetical protein